MIVECLKDNPVHDGQDTNVMMSEIMSIILEVRWQT
jgi:hypothetical protein